MLQSFYVDFELLVISTELLKILLEFIDELVLGGDFTVSVSEGLGLLLDAVGHGLDS